MIKKPSLIAIDWGTSNFRAFLLDDNGALLETRFAKQGILRVENGDFAQALREQVWDWLESFSDIPLLMSGMVGSRQGWKEVPYLACPVSLNQLATGLQSVPFQNNPCWIVPGLRVDYNDGRTDVMRGEETQIIGALSQDEDHLSQVFCLPGTHSKWAWVENGQLIHFTTFMTGEIFTLLAKHSILGRLMRGNKTDLVAFERGMVWAERSEEMLSQLFQVRTQVLANKLSTSGVHSFLSGMLIGYELKQALKNSIPEHKVTIIGNARIARLYAKSLDRYAIRGMVTDGEQVTAAGLFKIAKQANII